MQSQDLLVSKMWGFEYFYFWGELGRVIFLHVFSELDGSIPLRCLDCLVRK